MNRYYETGVEDFRIRFAQESDVGLILKFIKELADYEELLHEVVATEEILMESLFVKKQAEVIIGEYKGEPAGFALFFHNFSTFLTRRGLWLEDLYVRPAFRGHGVGSGLLRAVAAIAVDRRCGRFEWSVLDWNAPAIGFYERLGATVMPDWRIARVTGDALAHLGRPTAD